MKDHKKCKKKDYFYKMSPEVLQNVLKVFKNVDSIKAKFSSLESYITKKILSDERNKLIGYPENMKSDKKKPVPLKTRIEKRKNDKRQIILEPKDVPIMEDMVGISDGQINDKMLLNFS
jgi:hypothetical protein